MENAVFVRNAKDVMFLRVKIRKIIFFLLTIRNILIK